MNLTYRKITKKEIKPLAHVLAEQFVNYPLYDVFFPNVSREKKLKQVFYFFWFRLYTRRHNTYITSDNGFIVSALLENQKDRSPIGLYFNLSFIFGFLFNVPLKVLKLVDEFTAFEKPFQNLYYHPNDDCYVQTVCINNSVSKETLYTYFDLLAENRNIYCETHTKAHVRLYEMLGFHLCDVGSWHGVSHYVMRRDVKL